MCGRYGRRADKQKIAEAFHANASLVDVYFGTSDDCAPGSIQPVIHMSEESERDISLMRWGFKLPDRLLFNTRSEGIERSQFWKDKLAERRCIVPASSFFEWGAPRKGQPKPKYEISVPGRELIGLAGVWSLWKNPKTGEWEKTFSVVTTDPNGVMQPIHDRQPVILEPSEYEEWLSAAERPPVHLLRILPDERMKLEQIGKASVPETNEPPQKGLFD